MVKTITNKYPGKCECGRDVPAGAGAAQLAVKGGKWQTVCRPCVDGVTPTPADPSPSIDERPTFPLTDEQVVAVDAFRGGHSIAIQAGAGTGKTSTLIAIGKSTTLNGTLIAFNRAIVADVKGRLPRNITARTGHSVAYQQVGKHYRHRLDSPRPSSSVLARFLGIDPCVVTIGDQTKVLQPSTLAGYVVRAIDVFCRTADKAPGTRHVPYIDGIDVPDADGRRTYDNNDAVAAHLADAIDRAWADIQSTEGTLRMNPDHFLKLWELGDLYGPPVIPGDFLMVDEAQDTNPVMLSAIEKQTKQVVFVGDAQQAIYEWRGAIDAMATVPADATTYLTHSFRFGPEIAEVANLILGRIEGATLRLVGRGKAGKVESTDTPDAILTRTNAAAIGVVLGEIALGRRPYLVGGGGEVERFAKAARDLMAGRPTDHPELSIFETWAEVQAYAADDILGDELAPMVKLIDDHGVETVLSAVSNQVDEADADVVVSTAHKSKGREWDSVRLHGDFPVDRMDASEYRLLYVAVTRAKVTLDITECPAALEVVDPSGGE